MAKTRSPGYPAIGLKESIEKARMIYEGDYQNPIPRAVAATHMGYQSLNGKSLGVLSALVKFGLLEGRGDDTRVSDLAMTIIAHPPGAPERLAALREAAERPDLFSELESRFAGGRASDQALRSYLLTQKFIPAAADAAIRSYRETKALVDAESRGYGETDDEAAQHATEAMSQQNLPQRRPHNPALYSEAGSPLAPSPQLATGSEPFRIAIYDKHIELVARLETPQQVDDLIRRLKFGKMMITPTDQIARPDNSDDEPDGGGPEWRGE